MLLPRVFHAEGLRYGLAVLCLAGLIAGTGKPGIRGYDSIERFKALHLLLTGEVLEPPVDRKYNVSLGIMAIPLYLLGKVTATGPQEAQIKHIKTTVAHFNRVCSNSRCSHKILCNPIISSVRQPVGCLYPAFETLF